MDGWSSFAQMFRSAVGEILATVADWFWPETTFGDCKEIAGAGQQQVRFV